MFQMHLGSCHTFIIINHRFIALSSSTLLIRFDSCHTHPLTLHSSSISFFKSWTLHPTRHSTWIAQMAPSRKTVRESSKCTTVSYITSPSLIEECVWRLLTQFKSISSLILSLNWQRWDRCSAGCLFKVYYQAMGLCFWWLYDMEKGSSISQSGRCSAE